LIRLALKLAKIKVSNKFESSGASTVVDIIMF